MRSWNRHSWATAIAVFFHLIGLIGILFFDRSFFVAVTPLNLLLSLVLIFWTGPVKQPGFWLFFFTAALVGFSSEVVGVNTGKLFGAYQYGKVLGASFKSVPLIIAVNWFLIIYSAGITVHAVIRKLSAGLKDEAQTSSSWMKFASVVLDGATIAVFFDWIMEPVAVKLGYWRWLDGGDIPAFNYVSWFVISMIILICFEFLPFNKRNKFAVHLLLIQLMFFLLLRTFMIN
jgi:putative membrane protein